MIFTNKNIDFMKEPLFFGSGRNIVRLDLNQEQYIQKLTDRQLSQFWRPHDVGMGQDAKDYQLMSHNKREFFLKNLKFQTLLDSNASRGVFETLMPITTNPQLEQYWAAHGFFETIHSSSYAEIIKSLGIDASIVFDDIMVNSHILDRGAEVSDAFNYMHKIVAEYSINGGEPTDERKRALITSLYALNILENIMFKTSFMCSFAFAENNLMEGSSKIISLIAADETLHYTMTAYLIKRLKSDVEYEYLFDQMEDDIKEMYERVYQQDLKWIDYLYETDPALIGLSANALKAYSRYNLESTLKSVGLIENTNLTNPLPWSQKYMSRSNVQSAQMETDSISYLSGIIDKSTIEDSDW